jgi:hypothetical protein
VARLRQPLLSRERSIVSAALALVDEGLEAVSTRRLAIELGVSGPSLYNHVATKDDLLDAVVDAVVGEVRPVDVPQSRLAGLPRRLGPLLSGVLGRPPRGLSRSSPPESTRPSTRAATTRTSARPTCSPGPRPKSTRVPSTPVSKPCSTAWNSVSSPSPEGLGDPSARVQGMPDSLDDLACRLAYGGQAALAYLVDRKVRIGSGRSSSANAAGQSARV